MAVGLLDADVPWIDRIDRIKMVADRLWSHMCAISFNL